MQARITDANLATCGCIHPNDYAVSKKIPEETQICGKIYPGNFTRTLEQILCSEKNNHANSGRCRPSCIDQKLRSTIISKQWPLQKNTLSFYETFIKGTKKRTTSEKHMNLYWN